MSKVFLTGPDGLLGSNIVRELLHRNYEVRAMLYHNKHPITLIGLPIEIVYGDISDKDALIELSKGCDYFINVAAITDMWPSRGQKYFRINVKGAENAVEAVLKNKMKRLVHVGSASSFGYGTIDKPGNEMSDFKSGKYKVDYIDSKRDGQLKVLEAVKEKGLDAIVVCPTFMIGPYDSKPSSGTMIIAIVKGKMPAFSSGGKNWVYVKDVSTGVCNALTMGRSGEAYILGGENLTYVDAVTRIAASVGQKKIPKFIVPNGILKFIGLLGTLSGAITKKAPALTINLANIACDGHYFSPQKAIDELKIPQTPIEIGVKEAVDWFQENKYL
ncbi:MAG: NAD-dependent epimerase/dehydratase family protein [Bacteroidetes bacterium]|nr:NAD-dependent epimerase/dehydratase family protein [Bacteroidota bacterium]